jgi:hypothetical protein
MSLRERVRGRLDDIKEFIGDFAVGIAARMYGEPEIHIFSTEALEARDRGHFKAGVEFGKVRAGDPDLFVSNVLVEE